MDFALGAGTAFADLDPITDGLGVLLRRSSGTAGWRTNASGTVWSFLDKSAGPVATGIRKAKLVDRNAKLPGGVSVKLSGRDGSYAVGPFDVPLHVTAVLGAGAGRCVERSHARVSRGTRDRLREAAAPVQGSAWRRFCFSVRRSSAPR